MEKREEMLPLRRPIDHLCKVKNKWDEDYEDHLRQELFKDDREEEDDSIDEEEYQRTLWKHHERPGEKWDVPKKEKIEYFDTELSYELTGYRPITLDKGLDFDPAPFQEAGRTYLEKGRYTEYPPGTKPWKEYWKEQIRRCQEGWIHKGYRVTGDQYFFLNFYRMLTVNVGAAKTGSGRIESFPIFDAMQYAWFHYVEMAEILKLDCCCLKGRGVNKPAPLNGNIEAIIP